MKIYVTYEVKTVNDKIDVNVIEALCVTEEYCYRLYPFRDEPSYLQQLADQLIYIAFWEGKETERTKVSDDVERVVLEVNLQRLFAKYLNNGGD